MVSAPHQGSGSSYRFRNYVIVPHMLGSLTRYIDQRTKPGDFLCAVIQNDLIGAVQLGNPESVANLPAYVAYLHNMAPPDCWGSKEKFETWLAGPE